MDLEKLIEIVKVKFKDGQPNGYLLKWDDTRFFEEIEKLSKPFEITNETSFDYNFCNTYSIFNPSRKAKVREIVTLEISFIADVYQIWWIKNIGFGKVGKMLKEPSSISLELEKRIKHFLETNGFKEFDSNWSKIEVEGIELELSGKNPNLSKCLFVDYDG